MKEDTEENQEAYNEATEKWNKKLLVLRARSKNYAIKTILNKAKAIESAAFWQYADFDYRGRLYFIEPYLNFQGNDLARGLMMFADGKPIGEDGIKWLSILPPLVIINLTKLISSLNGLPSITNLTYKRKAFVLYQSIR